MAKRKRGDEPKVPATVSHAKNSVSKIAKTNGHIDVKTSLPVIQVVTGSYERVLHGFTASISDLSSSSQSSPSVQFADTFLFNAHASAIRCLALSPMKEPGSAESPGVYLATGGSDERVNVYHLAAAPVAANDKIPSMPTLGSNKISENPRNRELGTLMQHSSNITALSFPTRSKLLSAAEDNTIAISRVKDLTVVSTVKAPHPKVQGQPSGDTAPPGATPAGINDFAVHPSMKLMVSVGRGERCMRLWNLVTGKKAGVLNFNRETLQSIKESKYSSGEGRKIKWNPSGTEFAVAFERGAIVFGEDSKAKCKVLPQPVTKLHHISYLPIPAADDSSNGQSAILAVSTEDGRIVFYDMDTTTDTGSGENDSPIPGAKVLGQLGGKSAGVSGRVKDFEILSLDGDGDTQPHNENSIIIVITASSDGSVRVWHLRMRDLAGSGAEKRAKGVQVGKLVGTYETTNRITCLRAFVMMPAVDVDAGLSEFEGVSDDTSSDSD